MMVRKLFWANDMHELCFLSNLTSSEWAAWVQAIASALAIVAGAWYVRYQARRARLDACERDASALDGIARMLMHLRDVAVEARNAKREIERFPPNHPAEPSTRYAELAAVLRAFPMEAVLNEIAFEALLTARRVAREIEPLVTSEPELQVNERHQDLFNDYKKILEDQIKQVRDEARRRARGEPPTQDTSAA